MAVLGPNDPRAMHDTGRRWRDRNGKEHPYMRDSEGNESPVVAGSVADLSDPSIIFERLEDARLVMEEERDRHLAEMEALANDFSEG